MIRIILALLLFIGIERFCNWQTDGFRLYEVLSDIPNDPSWEMPSLSSLKEEEILSILQQPYLYLGKGEQCYAFVSSDNKYVLKLFRHSHLKPEKKLKEIPLPSYLARKRDDFLKKKIPDPRTVFPSCKLAFEHLQKETALVYLSLNKSCKHPTITLIDKGHVAHRLDLQKTEFALQKKAEPLFSVLEKKMSSQNQDAARQSLRAVFSCLSHLAEKGYEDTDTAIRRNMGFIEDEAILFDIGSIAVKSSPLHQEELAKKTYRIKRWIKKHHPSHLPLYEEEINKFLVE